MIVDSQVHLWKPESPERPWPPGGADRAQLKYPFSYAMMLKEMDSAGVGAAILVPPTWEGARNDYALEAVRKHPRRFAIMGRIELEKPESRALIPGWRDQPGMMGFRISFLGAQKNRISDGTADWFWPQAEPRS